MRLFSHASATELPGGRGAFYPPPPLFRTLPDPARWVHALSATPGAGTCRASYPATGVMPLRALLRAVHREPITSSAADDRNALFQPSMELNLIGAHYDTLGYRHCR